MVVAGPITVITQRSINGDHKTYCHRYSSAHTDKSAPGNALWVTKEQVGQQNQLDRGIGLLNNDRPG